MNTVSDTIAAVATPPGTGGVAVIRISGPEAIAIAGRAWRGHDLSTLESHRASLGKYVGANGSVLDEALATVFRSPRSYTGEDTVEISLHGSKWIQKEVLADLIRRGVRIAEPGEFTRRAFLNSRLDLAQAEGIADLIAASSRASHALALRQASGVFSKELETLRQKMIEFAALLELELDFSEEDVTFADRSRLLGLATEIRDKTRRLADSFASGSAFKEGVPTVIAGQPNAGKSSLLNLLAQEEKAIVTDVPGTTRDAIETTADIGGVLFRFVDTAGLRDTADTVEAIGISRTKERMRNARIVIWMIDSSQVVAPQLAVRDEFMAGHPEVDIITLFNKADLVSHPGISGNIGGVIDEIENHRDGKGNPEIRFSTKTSEGLERLHQELHKIATVEHNPDTELIVTNARHYEALLRTTEALDRAIQALDDAIPTDLIVQDIREATHHLGTITGSVTPTHLLHHIFSHFCIGK